jgi:hypothetical protein
MSDEKITMKVFLNGNIEDVEMSLQPVVPRMFVWRSEALRNFRPGHIVVVASDIATARQQALKAELAWLRANRSWWFTTDNTVSVDYADDYELFMERMHNDLAKPHQELTELFIPGSE